MEEAKVLIEATKFSTDGNTAMSKGSYDDAANAFSKAAQCYGEAAKKTTETKSREALLLLKESMERSVELAKDRKILEPYKKRMNEIKEERSKPEEDSKIVKEVFFSI